MKRLVGKVSFFLIAMIAMSSTVFIGSLLTMVDVLAPPDFSTSLATVQHISADSWLVFDVGRNETLYEFNADEVLPIASVTKLPAAKIFYDTQDVWATSTVTWSDVENEGRAGKLRVGQEYTFHTLLFPLLLESSNDAAGVFSRNDDILVSDMNDYVKNLGLKDTVFTDTSGLSAGNVSTGHELQTILRNIYIQNRHLIDITGLDSYLSVNNGWLNNNPFIKDSDYVGGKHGYTPEANRTAVALFNETLQNGRVRLIGYVLLGSDNLQYDMSLLRNHVQNHVRFQ